MKSFTHMSSLVAICSALGLLTFIENSSAQDLRLIGSGATFPFPIYSAWFKQFSKDTSGATVDYQAKGSGAGIQDLINRTVDFAGSDAAMTDEEIAKVKGGVVLIPSTAGEIVIAYKPSRQSRRSQAAA